MGQSLWTALQPIVNLNSGQVVGHEALLRGAPGTPWESPDALFAAADRLGHRVVLEFLARRHALKRLADLPDHHKLFINIDALSPEIPAMPGTTTNPSRVVLELSERQPVLDNKPLLDQVRKWRSAGHPIALDDYGAGYMGLGAVLALQPDILKLDRMIIAGIDRDFKRQVIARSVAGVSQDLGITLIAEGIETAEELAAVRGIGIAYGQGYFLGRPQADPVPQVTLPDALSPLLYTIPGQARHGICLDRMGS